MKNHRLLLAATIIALIVLASRAGAAIIVTGGALHAHVAVDGIVQSDDHPFVSPETVATSGISPGMGIPPGPALSAFDRVWFVDGQLGISTNTVWQPDGLPYPEVVASGSLSITQDTAQTIWVRINPNPLGHGLFSLPYQGQVSLDGADGAGNVFDTGVFPTAQSSSRHPFDFVVALSPGEYTLSWSATGHRDVLSSGGAGGFDFSMGVPEPSGLLLIAVYAPVFMGMKRGRRTQLRSGC